MKKSRHQDSISVLDRVLVGHRVRNRGCNWFVTPPATSTAPW